MELNELKPYPFCGGKASVSQGVSVPLTDEMVYKKLSELSYESPIEVMIGQMRMEREKRLEGESDGTK